MATANGNDDKPMDQPDIVIRRKTFLFRHSSSAEDSSLGSNKLEDHYEIGEQIARGEFSDIFLCTHLQNLSPKRAVKRLSKSRVRPEAFEKEISALQKVDHPNVLRLFESFEDDKYYWIVTEASTFGDLIDFLKKKSVQGIRRTEPQMKRLVRQILICVNHCHTLGIIHSDLKPENILLDDSGDENTRFERLTLCDFGFAQFYDTDARMNRFIGTPAYLAPEVYRRNYGPKCDVWSCGVLAFLLLVGELPFKGDTPQKIFTDINLRTDHFDLEGWQRISAEGKAFVTSLLAKDENNRPTAQEALQNQWFNNMLEPSPSDDDSTRSTAAKGPSLASWNHSLIKFSARQKLKQATYAFLVAQLTFKSHKKVIDEIFRTVDTNSDGRICRQEMLAAFQQNGKVLSDKELDDIFERVDIEQSGFLNYWEFLAATTNTSTMLCTDNLKIAFNMFDKSKSNSITAEDLKDIFRGHSTNQFPGVIKAIIQEVDKNGDGEISYDEFSKMMQENIMSSNRSLNSLEEW